VNNKFSYQQYQLKNDTVELTLLPDYGCYWTQLKFKLDNNWVDVLRPIPNQEELMREPFGSYLMAPWANRLENSCFISEGNKYKLKNNFPDGTAIHGDVRHQSWKIENENKCSLELSLKTEDKPDFNYPFNLSFSHSIQIKENGLLVHLTINNLDSRSVPVGFGYHPFFKRCLTNKDKDITLNMKADEYYPSLNQIPSEKSRKVSGGRDFREPHLFADPHLDDNFTQLKDQTIELIYSGSGVKICLELDSIFKHVVIYAPNDETGNPKDFVAVEPQTHMVNGFNFKEQGWENTGVKMLPPGESWGGNLEINFEQL